MGGEPRRSASQSNLFYSIQETLASAIFCLACRRRKRAREASPCQSGVLQNCRAQASYCSAKGKGAYKSCSATQEGRSGEARTRGHGASQKASSRPTRRRSQRRGVSLSKRPATDRTAALSSLEQQDSLGARLFTSGLSRRTGTPPSLKATRSNWSGRRDRVVVRPFPKSIGRNGSASRSRGRRSSRARPSSSIGSQKSFAGQTTDDCTLRGLSRSRTASLAARAPLGSRSWIKLRSRALPDKRAA
jgi:hypothetical protein